jgi:hypothetical protein
VAQIVEWKKEEHVSKRSTLFAICAWSLAAMLTQPLLVSAPAEVSKDAANTMEVICLTEQPAIVEGESATLKAWASTPDGQPVTQRITFQWTVEDGRITTQAAEARWDLSSVKVEPREGRKKLTATVRATAPGMVKVGCTVEVFIGRKETVIPDRGTIQREKLFSAKRFLLPGESEEPGYGLYSYLLLSAPPMDTEANARYVKTIEAYLLLLQNIDEFLRKHVRPSRLNATYIPLKEMPKPVRETPEPGKSNAEWAANILAVYDYTAAKILLGNLDKSARKGPYLVAVLKPLSEMNTPACLFDDFTGVVPELVSEQVEFFTFLAAQERSWSEEALERLAHKLRNLVAVGGKVAPDTLKGLARMIRFERGL